MEDVVILGKRIPKGTIVMIPGSIGFEDRSTPTYGDNFASQLTGEKWNKDNKEDVTIQYADALAPVRGDTPERKCRYWEAGTGRDL
jgi:hypothetical protein